MKYSKKLSPAVVMSKSISEHLNRFYLEAMEPLKKIEKAEESRKFGRSSISSIPPVDLSMVLKQKPIEKKVVQEVKQQSGLCDELCNAYKFVVNYGVFEPNYEWLPFEVCDIAL